MKMKKKKKKKKKRYENDFNFKGINFLVSIKNIEKFEKNPDLLGINVFTNEGTTVIPLRIKN